MTDRFINSIKVFLNSGVENTLLIDGPWGMGKTYYVKSKQFEEDINRKVIYTTVFGLKDLNEIDDQITYEKLKLNGYVKAIIKNPNTKIALSFAKKLSKGLLKRYVGLEDNDFTAANEFVQDVGKTDISELISIGSDQILVIDDLERLDKNISYHDLFGFVYSNYAEGAGIKVLLICNEEFIKEMISKGYRKGEPYAMIKEKTIWKTISFEANLEKILSAFIQDQDSKLKANYSSIVNELAKRCRHYRIDNLRTINYTFDLLNQILDKSNTKISDNYRVPLFCSTIILVNEFKEGRLSKQLGESGPKYYSIERPVFSKDFMSQMSDEYRSCMKNFSDRYLRRERSKYYYYYESIEKFIVEDIFNPDSFEEELRNNNNDGGIVLLEHLLLIQEVQGYIYLEDEQLQNSLNRILDFIEEEKYDIYSLLSIAELVEKFHSMGMSNRFTDVLVYTLLNRSIESSFKFSIYNEKSKHFRHGLDKSIQRRQEFYKFYEIILDAHIKLSGRNVNHIRNEVFRKILEGEDIDQSRFFFLFEGGSDVDLNMLSEHYSESTFQMNKLYDLFYDSAYILEPRKQVGKISTKKLEIFGKALKSNTRGKFVKSEIASDIVEIIQKNKTSDHL